MVDSGRGIHIGDTVLGIKGRIAFEAPGALVLIAAHRELEKLTTTHWQRFWKDHLGEFYGKLLHEGNVFEPVLADIEAFLEHSQQRVEGDARVRLEDRHFEVIGVRSPNSLMGAGAGIYGEEASLWTGQDVAGFSRITGIPAKLFRRHGETEK